MARHHNSWIYYLEDIDQQILPRQKVNIKRNKRFSCTDQNINYVRNQGMVWLYMLDFSAGKFSMITDPLQNYLNPGSEEESLRGLSFIIKNYQSDHRRIFEEEIFPDRIKFLQSIPSGDHPKYIFSYNFQINNKGKTIHLLQRNRFLKSDKYRKPLISYGVITNINPFDSNLPVVQMIEKMDSSSLEGSPEIVFRKKYYPHNEDRLFTKRESELLHCLICGLSSKEIADKLFISEYTVINHRRNMMLKTESRNVSQLISFAFMHNLI